MSPLPPFEQTDEPATELHVEVAGDHFEIHTQRGAIERLGFDVVQDRIERYALELFVDAPQVPAGTMHAYDTMRALQEALKLRFERTGEKSGAELTDELLGYEGQRVMAVTLEGEVRSFLVARAKGWMPHHIELRDDGPARRAERRYARVYGGAPDERQVDP